MAVVMFLVATFLVARLLVARLFASDLDFPFAWMPVPFDDHLSPGAIVATVTSVSALAATCHQRAGSDHTENNDLSNRPASSHDELL